MGANGGLPLRPCMLSPRIFILFIAVIFCQPAWAQSLNGVITDARSGKPLYPVSVINNETRQYAYSNEFGEYSIVAKPGQKISFSIIGYQTITQSMPPSLGAATMNIKMQAIGYELDEVIIRPKYTPYQADSIQRRRTYSRALSQRHASVMSPVSFIAEKFSKSSKQVFRFQQNYEKWETEKFIDTRYTAELVTTLTGLTGDSLGHFMNAYPMEEDYARAATELEIKMWVRSNFREWKKRRTDSLSAPFKKP